MATDVDSLYFTCIELWSTYEEVSVANPCFQPSLLKWHPLSPTSVSAGLLHFRLTPKTACSSPGGRADDCLQPFDALKPCNRSSCYHSQAASASRTVQPVAARRSCLCTASSAITIAYAQRPSRMFLHKQEPAHQQAPALIAATPSSCTTSTVVRPEAADSLPLCALT